MIAGHHTAEQKTQGAQRISRALAGLALHRHGRAALELKRGGRQRPRESGEDKTPEALGAGARYAPLDQKEVARLLTFQGTPRAFRRDRQWRRLLQAGTRGALAEYLSYGRGRWRPKLDALPFRERVPVLQADLLRNFPALLKSPASSTPVSWPSIANVVGLPALLESLVFMRFGFVPLWCKHGKHWFLSDDCRRDDCVDHRYAGQKARARTPAAYAKELQHRRERRRELRIIHRHKSRRA